MDLYDNIDPRKPAAADPFYIPPPAAPVPAPALDPEWERAVAVVDARAAKKAAAEGPLAEAPPEEQAAPAPAADPAFSVPYDPAAAGVGGGVTSQLVNAGSRTTEQGQLSAEQKANMAEQKALVPKLIENEERRDALAKEQAIQAANAAEYKALLLKKREEQIAQVDLKANEAIEKAKANYQAEVAKKKAAREGIREYWSEQPRGNQVIAALLVMANAIVRGATGQASDALATYQNISKEDRERKLQAVEAMSEDVAIAATGIQDAKEAKIQLRQDVMAKSQALEEKAAAQVESVALSNGVQLADIQKNANINAIKQNALQIEQQGLAPTTKRISDTRNSFVEHITTGGAAGADPVKATEDLNKIWKDDPEKGLHDDAVKAGGNARKLLAGLDDATKAGGSALGLYMTNMASAAQTGVLSDKDMARAMGNEYKSLFQRTKEGVEQYVGGKLPASTIKSIRLMLADKAQASGKDIEKYQRSLIEKAGRLGLDPGRAANLLGNSEVRITPEQQQGPPLTPEKVAEFKALIKADPKNPKAQQLAMQLAARGIR